MINSTAPTIARDYIQNHFLNKKLHYIVEAAAWSIKCDGLAITGALTKNKILPSRITTTPLGVRNSLLHFGSFGTFFFRNKPHHIHPSNRGIWTIFHILQQLEQYSRISDMHQRFSIIHTSSNLTKQVLLQLGVPAGKIKVIPIGVHQHLFRPARDQQKQQIRRQLKIPADSIVIGSFQKDGQGWQQGLEPKLEKGPDIFIESVKLLAQSFPVFVLLVGPARGYVEQKLKANKIPYRSMGYLHNLQAVSRYYKALNIYLITSRVEGGPKAILESWSARVPVVSTKVGMVPDIATHNENALLVDIEDSHMIAEHAARLISETEFRQNIIERGAETVGKYDWLKIAKRYNNELYQPLLR